jgi:methyl-accepting chemotaxis protein
MNKTMYDLFCWILFFVFICIFFCFINQDLDELAGALANMNSIAQDMNKEINDQNKRLDKVATGVDKQNKTIEKNSRAVKKML